MFLVRPLSVLIPDHDRGQFQDQGGVVSSAIAGADCRDSRGVAQDKPESIAKGPLGVMLVRKPPSWGFPTKLVRSRKHFWQFPPSSCRIDYLSKMPSVAHISTISAITGFSFCALICSSGKYRKRPEERTVFAISLTSFQSISGNPLWFKRGI